MTTVNDDVSKLATGDNEQGTPQENAEDDENASNEDKATNPPTEQENGENGANTEPDKATEEQIIGHFGLGFYSAFMVADEVHIDTLSYKDGAKAVHWECDGGTEYEGDSHL